MGLFDQLKRVAPADPAKYGDKIKDLCERADVTVRSADEKGVQAIFSFEDNRSQLVIARYVGVLRGKPIVDIDSAVLDLDEHPLPADVALQLLERAGSLLLGRFVISGRYLLIQHSLFLDEATPKCFRIALAAVAATADEAEKVLTGGDAL